jgi:hypothetical protein
MGVISFLTIVKAVIGPERQVLSCNQDNQDSARELRATSLARKEPSKAV